MKKAKRQDKTLLMLCIGVVFMLIVTAVMSFAYFTAKAESQSQQIQFGVLELDSIDGFTLKNEENTNINIVPGCTINMAGIIKLTTASNVDAFVRLKPTVKVTKDGQPVTNVSENKFVALFNEALSAGTGSSWLKRNDGTTDDYLYFVGKFSNVTTVGERIVESFDFGEKYPNDYSVEELKGTNKYKFTIDPTTFGNEWQGVTVSIGLTVQAIQASHVGVDNVNATKYDNATGSNNGDQALVNDIAKAEAWSKVESGNGSITPEPVKPATINKLTFTIDSTNNTASVKAINNAIEGEVVIPAYIKANANGYDEVSSGEAGAIPVTSIGQEAFRECSSLTNIVIPNTVTTMGKYAFYYCNNLTSITIPSSVTSIGYGALYCIGLKGKEYDGIEYLGNENNECMVLYEVKDRKKSDYKIKDNVKIICYNAFANCIKLASITIPNSVTSIGESAFSSCSGLTSITIPSSVTSIGRIAFSGCSSLKSITIPSSVTSIGDAVFSRCIVLETITVKEGNETYTTKVNGIECNAIIEKSTNKLIAGCKNTVIPEGVTSIGQMAFLSCNSLKSIKIPEGVTSIGEKAFSYCSSLESVTVKA